LAHCKHLIAFKTNWRTKITGKSYVAFYLWTMPLTMGFATIARGSGDIGVFENTPAVSEICLSDSNCTGKVLSTILNKNHQSTDNSEHIFLR